MVYMIGDNVRNIENWVWPGDKGTYTYYCPKKHVVHSTIDVLISVPKKIITVRGWRTIGE